MISKTTGPGGSPAVYPSAHQPGHPSRTQNAQNNPGQYDQVNISKKGSNERCFQKELTSRLVNEVRTANTTSKIQHIMQEVASGRYQPNPREIAARLLLEGTVGG